MMKHLFRLSVLLLSLSVILGVGVCSAGILGPGVYEGYFTIDRWGQKVLYNGPSHFFVSDQVAKQLAEHENQLLKLDVKEMYQPMNPGGGIIDSLASFSVEKASALALNIQAKDLVVKHGDGIKLHLTAHNTSDTEVKLVPNDMSLVLVTNSPFSNAAIGYKDPEDRAYWYYRQAVRPRGEHEDWLKVACRVVPLAWSPKEYAANGQNVVVGPQSPTQIDPGYYYPLIVKPNGTVQIDVVVGAELLPGQYEVFLQRSKTSSQRIRFDIVKHGDRQ